MQPVSQPSVRNYNNVGTRNNGFQYRIMPLAFNLQLRGNGSTSCVVTRCIFNIGDTISGECVYDNKKYTGKIVNIVFDEEDDPLSLYIMDSATRMVLPIKADSAKILPKKLSENYSFDKAISSFLFNDDDEDLLNTDDDVYGSLESNAQTLEDLKSIKEIFEIIIRGNGLLKNYEVLQVSNMVGVVHKNKEHSNIILAAIEYNSEKHCIDKLYTLGMYGVTVIQFILDFIYICPIKVKRVLFLTNIYNGSARYNIDGLLLIRNSDLKILTKYVPSKDITIDSKVIKKLPVFYNPYRLSLTGVTLNGFAFESEAVKKKYQDRLLQAVLSVDIQ